MAVQTIELALVKSVGVFENIPNYSKVEPDNYYIFGKEAEGTRRAVLLSFEPLPSALRHQRLYSVKLKGSFSTSFGVAPIFTAPEWFTDFEPADTKWNNINFSEWANVSLGGLGYSYPGYAVNTIPTGYITPYTEAGVTVPMLARPIALLSDSTSSYRLSVSSPPVLVVEYDDALSVDSMVCLNKRGGYINPHIDQTFSWTYEDWDLVTGYHTFGPIEQASAVFKWRESGAQTWNTIPINSSVQSVTVPAETLTVAQVMEWTVEGTDSEGHTSTALLPDFFYTIDGQMNSYIEHPAGVVVNNTEPLTFRWRAANSTGATPTGADLEYRTSGGAWTSLATISGADSTYTVPAGTFTAGAIYWRVRSYNADGVAGNWSPEGAFVYYAAPEVQGVSATPVPFSTISWQADDQQTYEIFTDGKSVGVFFGDAKTHELRDALFIGPHTVGVRVQNSFSLWSEIATYSFTVSNTPGDAVTLTARFGIDAQLEWTTDSEEPVFRVYRDGICIGITDNLYFTDRYALGEHEYMVRNVLPGGYYTESSRVTGIMKSCTTIIASLDPVSAWMELRLTANDPDEQIFGYQRTASLRHFTGATFPVLELSKFEDVSASYNVAFHKIEDAQAFNALFGRPVIIKSRGGKVMIGALIQLQERVGDFFISYSFTIQRIEWEDFVDDQNS